jgi:hypothetical protein
VAAPVKASIADRVKAVLGSGTPKPKTRAPMADVERHRSGPIPVPASKPEQPRFASNFMPEMTTGEAHDAPAQVAATQGAAAEGKSWKDKLGDAMTNPLTMAGLALLASNSPMLGGAIGEAGLAAAKTVADRKRQEKEDARLAKQDALEERKLGVGEGQLKATINERAAREADRQADNARQEATLGPRRQEVEDNKAYNNARLGQYNQGLALQRQQEARLGRAALGGAGADPTKKVVLLKLREQLGTLMADPMSDPADIQRLQSQIAGVETTDPAAALAASWPGFKMDEKRG